MSLLVLGISKTHISLRKLILIGRHRQSSFMSRPRKAYDIDSEVHTSAPRKQQRSQLVQAPVRIDNIGGNCAQLPLVLLSCDASGPEHARRGLHGIQLIGRRHCYTLSSGVHHSFATRQKQNHISGNYPRALWTEPLKSSRLCCDAERLSDKIDARCPPWSLSKWIFGSGYSSQCSSGLTPTNMLVEALARMPIERGELVVRPLDSRRQVYVTLTAMHN